jgi:hypothetical protein
MVIAFVLCLTAHDIVAQDSIRARNSFLSTGFLQIKESPNYGLVFRGPFIGFGMNWNWLHDDNTWFYEAKLGVGFPFAKEIVGLNMNFKPIEMAYAWKIPVRTVGLEIGPSLKMEYNIQYYPDLQSGYYYWLTHYSAGVEVFADYKFKNSILKLRAFNNLFGFVSRGEIYEDPYFFDRKFSDIFSDVHSNFNFVSLGTFNNTFFEIRYQKKASSRLAFSYVFDYFTYTEEPEIKYLNQLLRLTFIPRMKNEN